MDNASAFATTAHPGTLVLATFDAYVLGTVVANTSQWLALAVRLDQLAAACTTGGARGLRNRAQECRTAAGATSWSVQGWVI